MLMIDYSVSHFKRMGSAVLDCTLKSESRNLTLLHNLHHGALILLQRPEVAELIEKFTASTTRESQ
jgi:hypothetical protein